MGQGIEPRLKPLGISCQEIRIAGLLMGEHGIPQKGLAEKLAVRPATLSVALSKLEAQGILKRIPSQTGRRVNYLRLMQGEKITRVDNILKAVEFDMTEGISKNDLETTSRVLEKIAENLKTLAQPENRK